MKHILFLCLVLAACIANAKEFTTEIVNTQATEPAKVFEISIEDTDPNLEIKSSGATMEAQVVEDCAGCNTNTSKAPQALASVQETGQHLERVSLEEGWQDTCDGFVKDGKIGLYGQIVREEVMRPTALKNIKQGDADLSRLCPNYPTMNTSSKANVILLIMTSMAYEESSCNNNKSARGPNGTAKGFFQLHLGSEANYSSECANYDSRTPRGSITCALSILNKQMSEGYLFRQDENYWDVLRPKRWDKKTKRYFANPSFKEIRSAISSFEPCAEKKQISVADNNEN